MNFKKCRRVISQFTSQFPWSNSSDITWTSVMMISMKSLDCNWPLGSSSPWNFTILTTLMPSRLHNSIQIRTLRESSASYILRLIWKSRIMFLRSWRSSRWRRDTLLADRLSRTLLRVLSNAQPCIRRPATCCLSDFVRDVCFNSPLCPTWLGA